MSDQTGAPGHRDSSEEALTLDGAKALLVDLVDPMEAVRVLFLKKYVFLLIFSLNGLSFFVVWTFLNCFFFFFFFWGGGFCSKGKPAESKMFFNDKQT